MTPILAVEHVSVIRDGVPILDDVSWRVEPGEHWVLLGPNGSGKTSLLAVLAAYLPATRGTFSVLGERYGASDWRVLRSRIGVVSSALPSLMPSSEPGLDVVLSGRDATLGRLGAVAEDARARARELLARVGCEHLEKRPWRVLSAGERQRLLIARALMARPALLVLDEPCAGLDPVARTRFLGTLEALVGAAPQGHETRPAIVLVTHHVEEIVPGFTHGLLLGAGRVVAHGPLADALTSATLTRAFGAPIELVRDGARLGLRMDASPTNVPDLRL